MVKILINDKEKEVEAAQLRNTKSLFSDKELALGITYTEPMKSR